jgi:hypothetical protein
VKKKLWRVVSGGCGVDGGCKGWLVVQNTPFLTTDNYKIVEIFTFFSENTVL